MSTRPWVPTFVAGALVAATLLILGGSCWVGRANERARMADATAAEAVGRAKADSMAAADLRDMYERERADKEQMLAALAEADRQLAEEQERQAVERRRHAQKLDSLVALLDDGGEVAAALANERRAWAAEREALLGRVVAVTRQLDTEHGLRVRAEEGWAVETQAAQAARDALARQIEATEAWRRVAHPGLAVRIGRGLPAVGIGAGLTLLGLAATR